MKTNHNNFLKLAFNIAKVNLGKTGINPSVGCVVVKNNSVISSACTSINGRPHAEFNALKSQKNFKNSDLYVTLEPCTHYGVTPPCTNIIAKKGVKRVFFSFDDIDTRTTKRSKKILGKKKIKVYKKFNNNFKDFYQSYFLNQKDNTPFIDAKIAISKDYLTINKKAKWITNSLSRKRTHLIRSEYDAIISTSKSINKDNSLLNCRLAGFNSNKPDLIIIDGGQPYLKICQEIIDESAINESIKLIGVSKGFKRDFRFDRYHTLSEKNLSLKDSPQIEGFIQKMRDQAHKLSKKNSMKRMSDSLKTSFLDDISGIGKIKKMRVINFFGSVQNLKKANKDELTQIKGLNSKNIKAILDKING